jgi:hypothetical protein
MPTSPPAPQPVAPHEERVEVSHTDAVSADEVASQQEPPIEVGGRGGLEPTRFGDWEKNGRCIDF